MKKINVVVMLIMFLGVGMLSAQKKEIDLFTVPLSSPGQPGMLKLGQISGNINVSGYEGKEVIVKVNVYESDKSSKETKNGMKRVGNSGLNISAEEDDNVVTVNNKLWNGRTDFVIKVPYNFSLKLSTVNDGDINVDGVTGDLEISNVNGAIALINVEGAVSANTTNGPVKVDFKRMGNATDMAFSSFNGNVEVSFPSSVKANIKAKSDMGDVYTDFDMAVQENKPETQKKEGKGTYKVKVEQWVRGKINGGGPEMLFKTFNGDIMIKSKA